MKILYYILMFTCLMVFFYKKHYIGKQLFLLGPLLICSITVEVITDYQRGVLHSNSLYQYHIYQPIEFILFTLLFYSNVKNVVIKRAMLISIPVFLTIMSCYYIMHPQAFNSEKFIDFQLESFFLIIWAILYLFELVSTDHVMEPILNIPLFWLSFAVLLFYAGNMFIMGFRDFIYRYEVGIRENLMLVPQYLNLLFYFMITVGLLCTGTQRKSSSV